MDLNQEEWMIDFNFIVDGNRPGKISGNIVVGELFNKNGYFANETGNIKEDQGRGPTKLGAVLQYINGWLNDNEEDVTEKSKNFPRIYRPNKNESSNIKIEWFE